MSLARSARPAIFFPAGGHFDPVQFFFHLMKRIVADLLARAHGENSLARGQNSLAVDIAVGELSGVPFFGMGIDGSQVRDEFQPDCLGGRRSVMLEP